MSLLVVSLFLCYASLFNPVATAAAVINPPIPFKVANSPMKSHLSRVKKEFKGPLDLLEKTTDVKVVIDEEVCVYVYMYVCMYVCAHAFMCLYVYTCVYVYI